MEALKFCRITYLNHCSYSSGSTRELPSLWRLLCETVTEALLFFLEAGADVVEVLGVDFPFLALLFVSNLKRRYPVGERKNDSTILGRFPPLAVEVEVEVDLMGRKCDEKGSGMCVSVGVDGYDVSEEESRSL